jgi:hypothetical protein
LPDYLSTPTHVYDQYHVGGKNDSAKFYADVRSTLRTNCCSLCESYCVGLCCRTAVLRLLKSIIIYSLARRCECFGKLFFVRDSVSCRRAIPAFLRVYVSILMSLSSRYVILATSSTPRGVRERQLSSKSNNKSIVLSPGRKKTKCFECLGRVRRNLLCPFNCPLPWSQGTELIFFKTVIVSWITCVVSMFSESVNHGFPPRAVTTRRIWMGRGPIVNT